ncbi:MAG TPA: Yip1 family protein [Thermoanaerobaculia bacterium]|nr:Yip1 family protein [Thermoanaerobaculia bacterium]
MENSAFGRLIGVLVAPQKTFRSIAERPTWLVAFLVLALSPLLGGLVAKPKIDWEEVARHQIERSAVDLTPAQVEQQVEITAKIGPFFIYAAPVFMLVGVLLFALVFWGAFTLAGGEPGFKRSLAVTVHAMMPMVVAGLLAVPVILGMDTIPPEVLETGGYLKSNLGAFAPEGAGIVLVTFLSKIDVFTIWCLVLCAIGFTHAAKVKARTAAITVGLLWLVWVVVTVGLAGIGALMGGKKG